MKHFRLAGAGYRDQIKLTVYRTDIEEAVRKVKPGAIADVHDQYFTTSPELTKRESIEVSMILRQGSMAELTTYRPCLFNSTQKITKAEMEEDANGSRSNGRQKVGGRRRDSGEISTNQQEGNKETRQGKS